MSLLYPTLKALLDDTREIVLTRRPLALSTGIDKRLKGAKGDILLITADLDDPLPAWSQTRLGKRFVDRVSWMSLADIAADQPAVATMLQGIETTLPTAMALTSPRLAPVLAQLLPALGRNRQNERNWTWTRKPGGLDASLYALNVGTQEVLKLRITHQGLERWASLHPGELNAAERAEKYPVTWMLRPEDALDMAAALKG